MTAEEKIHVALLAVVAAASALLFGAQHPPSAPNAPAHALSAHGAGPAAPIEIQREELDAAIAALKDSLQRRFERAEDPRELALAVAALGRAALGSPPEPALGRLVRSWPPALTSRAVALANASEASPAPAGPESPLSGGEALPLALLGTLLEAGVSIEQRVPLDTGSTTVGALVRAALDLSSEASHDAAGLRLDLGAFAALAGMRKEAAGLDRLAYETLRRLELGYREWNSARAEGGLDAATLARLGAPFRAGGELQPSAAELHASAAVFRAVAVLGEPDLDQQARRHLGALAYRYRVERALYAQLLAEAQQAAARERVHFTALERLGRLQQALYQAHLLQRTEQRHEPTPELGKLMRQVARDLLDQLRDVGAGAASDAQATIPVEPETRLRAMVHALRGLRTARVAI